MLSYKCVILNLSSVFTRKCSSGFVSSCFLQVSTYFLRINQVNSRVPSCSKIRKRSFLLKYCYKVSIIRADKFLLSLFSVKQRESDLKWLYGIDDQFCKARRIVYGPQGVIVLLFCCKPTFQICQFIIAIFISFNGELLTQINITQ